MNIISKIWPLAFLLCMTSTAEDKENKEADKVYREVKKLMEMMTLPRLGLYKLTGEGDYSSDDFIFASKEVIKQANKMKDIQHPDKAFQKTNREMLKALKEFEIALKSAKEKQIKNKWQLLNIKCNSCHALYNIK